MALFVNNLSKNYGKQKALNSVSFEVLESGIIGLLGPNGAGKSTLMKIICGYLTANEGSVKIDNLTNEVDQTMYRAHIGYLPENNPLYNEMYVVEYLDFIADINNVKANKSERIEEVILQVGLTKERKKKIGQLSKGYRQRVGLASALLPNPKVLILDEPTTGLDPLQILEIRELIKSVSKEKIVLLSTHIMQEVQALCSRVLIIKNGEIVADESAENLSSLVKARHAEVTIEFDVMPDISIFKDIESVLTVTPTAKNTIVITTSNTLDIRAELFNFAVSNKLVILSISRKEVSMEEIFQELAG